MLFMLMPEEDAGLAELLPLFGADERMHPGSWSVMHLVLREAAGDSRQKNWLLHSVRSPDDDTLAMVADAISEQLREHDQVVFDLEEKMVTVAECKR